MQAPISADLLVGNYISDYARHLGEKRPRCSEYINPFACRITWDHPERYRIMAVMMHQDYAQLDRARYHGSHANWPLFLKTAVINLAVLEKERGGGLYLTAPPGEAELAVRSHSWWKLIALRNALQYAPSDWLLWMDSDAHLVHSASELLGRLPEHIRSHKNALCHNPTMYVAREEPCKELRHPTSNFNLGVILLNATKVERVDATPLAVGRQRGAVRSLSTGQELGAELPGPEAQGFAQGEFEVATLQTVCSTLSLPQHPQRRANSAPLDLQQGPATQCCQRQHGRPRRRIAVCTLEKSRARVTPQATLMHCCIGTHATRKRPMCMWAASRVKSSSQRRQKKFEDYDSESRGPGGYDANRHTSTRENCHCRAIFSFEHASARVLPTNPCILVDNEAPNSNLCVPTLCLNPATL